MNLNLNYVCLFILLVVNSAATIPVEAPSSQEQHANEAKSAETADSFQAEETDYKSLFKLNLLPLPEKNAESVNLESEGIPSKILTAYDEGQKKLVHISNPVPIIDSISELDKYGNNGDMFDGISRSIVNGYEAFSNLLNTLIQKPKELARSISKGITAQLDVIGGKLVGL